MRPVAKFTDPKSNEPTVRERQFADEYLVDLDPRSAAVRAGYAPETGPRMLGSRRIQMLIQTARRQRTSRTQIYADEALRRWTLLASARVTSIYHIFRPCCRYCWGIDFRFQFTQNEIATARREHLMAQKKLNPGQPELWEDFDEEGGIGYNRTRQPNPECPECNGIGDPPFMVIKDSRDLDEEGQVLLDGVKVGRAGEVEIKLRDRNWAETMVGKHLGLFKERRGLETLDPEALDDEALEAALTSLMRRGIIEVPGGMVELEAEELEGS